MTEDDREIPNEPPELAPPPAEAPSAPVRSIGRRNLPMADIAAEAALVGAVLEREDVAWPAASTLSAADFAWPSYQRVFGAMQALADHGRAIGPISVADELRKADVLHEIWMHDTRAEGIAAIWGLSSPGVAGWRQAKDYVEIVRRHAVERRVAEASDRALDAAKRGDLDAASDALEAATSAIVSGPSAGLLAWEDVSAAVRGEEPDVVPSLFRRSDGVALMYEGLTHWLMGEPGKGKTWAALHVVAEVLLAGRCAVYLDWEGNRRIIGSRLRALGVPADVVADRLLYLRPPAIARIETAALVATARQREAALVVCDGVAKALARQGLNEDKAPEVLTWLELVPNPLAETGAAVLMLDHVTKDRDGRGLWARGSGAKLGEVSGAAWLVVPRQGFSRHQGGRFDLLQAKDREGYVATDGAIVASVSFTPVDGGDRLQVVVKAPDDAGGEFRPTGYMERVSRALEGLPDPITWNALRTIVRGRLEHVRVALELLVSEGFVAREPGPRNSQLLRSTKPYREADEEATNNGQEVLDEQF